MGKRVGSHASGDVGAWLHASGKSSVMFVGIVLVSPHETITRPLGSPRGLKACVTC